MSATDAGFSLETVDTVQQYPLGTKFVEAPSYETETPGSDDATLFGVGERIWTYVYNDEATLAFAEGHLVYRIPASTAAGTYGCLITPVDAHQPRISVVGAAQHAIAAGSYGWVLTKGRGSLRAGSANIALGVALTTGGDDDIGTALTYADGTNNENIGIIGFSMATGNTDDTAFEALIDCGG